MLSDMKRTPGDRIISIGTFANILAFCLIVIGLIILVQRRCYAKPAPARTVLDTKIRAIGFRNASLVDVIEELSRASGVAINFDPQVASEGENYVTLNKGPGTLDSALRALFAKSALGDINYYADARAVYVAPANAVPVIGRIYDVHDIVGEMVENERHYGPSARFPMTSGGSYGAGSFVGAFSGRWAPATRPSPYGNPQVDQLDDLVSLIAQTVTPDWWVDSGGNVAAMRGSNGRIFVLHIAEGHRQIERLLLQLRIADAAPARSISEPSVLSAQ